MARRPLRILCFGDSLTAGYTTSGLKYHPYQMALSSKLREAFPGLPIEISVDGMDGGLTQHFSWRLRKVYRELGPSLEVPFDWLIILGGTNDLALHTPPETIFENLERTWSFAKLRKGKVLAITVPELARATKPVTSDRDRQSSTLELRDALNSLILGHKAPGYHALDLNAAFSQRIVDAEYVRYYDDMIHFTSAGYDLIGELVAESLIKIFKKEDKIAAGPQTTTLSSVRPRERKLFQGDDNYFDEEKTEPDSLQHGYIVVRRKDLD